MLNTSLTLRTRSSAGALVKSLCLALGLAFTFAPSALTAQDKKPAADKKAPVEEEEKDAAPATPRSEKDALKEFKSDMAAIKKWTIAEQAKAKQNPMAGLKMVGEMNSKIGKVRTDGLPEDLAGEYKKMTGVIKQMAALFKGMPEDEAELMSWAQSKFTDPAFGEKMQALGKEATETGEKLKTIGKKYGLDEELDFDG
ncbi:MAG TPA: hypothetical protein VHM91_20790, partial [Verrucomicrobiales bacterium]|nr:hypothetical protein [Verrucomicrobiales bacterium]